MYQNNWTYIHVLPVITYMLQLLPYGPSASIGSIPEGIKGCISLDKSFVKAGAYEPPKAAKERQTQHAGRSGSSITSHLPNFYLIRQEAIT